MRILCSGGNGFIGRAVVTELQAKGHEVESYDLVNGDDIMDGARITARMKGFDAALHLSGVLGTNELFSAVHQAIDTNIHGSANVLEACRLAKAAYVGVTMPQVFPSIYAATKACSTRFATAYHVAYGMPVSHVRAFNAFGPGQAHGPGHPRKIIPYFACEAWANRPIEIWGDGEQTVDLISTTELAKVFAAAVEVGDDSTIDGGTGVKFTVNQVAQIVIDITGSTAGVKHSEMRRGEVPTQIVAGGEGWEHLARPPKFDPVELIAAVESYHYHPLAHPTLL